MTSFTPIKTPWWHKEQHAARRERLLQRGQLRRGLTEIFLREDFIEVEAGQLQTSPGNETHLHGFATEMRSIGGRKAPLYLHTSPEFACKKLIAAGEKRIFDFARVFRNRERGALHAPEFTMLEWYRAEESYEQLMLDCGAILAKAAEITGRQIWQFRGRSIDATLTPERLTVLEAFERYAKIPLFETYEGDETDRDALAAHAKKQQIRIADDDSWSDIFSRILLEKIEPNIGNGRATILMEYPLPEAALARRKAGSQKLAERFELYACGVELANAFGELTDAAEQKRRFEADMALKQAIYGEIYPIDADFLDALSHMPEASGAALGFDRLVMLATGADHIDQVIWTPTVDPFAEEGP
jgi:elongation factor P--(R)-beta-lysine ligase